MTSADIVIFEWCSSDWMPLIYTKNNNGPKMLPCGTSMVIFAGGDNALTHIICWTQPERDERNHSKLFPATPSDLSLLMRSRWSTVSNALPRSRNTVPVMHPLSILSRTWSVKAIKAVEVERFSRKPNCDLIIICFLPKRKLRGSLPKSSPRDFATKNTFPLFFFVKRL